MTNYKDLEFICWDVGSMDRTRPLWRHYYQDNCGIIFMVDSRDRERLFAGPRTRESVYDALHRTLAAPELAHMKLLIFANRQDRANAMSVEEITEKLDLQ